MVEKLKGICELVCSQEVGIPILLGLCLAYFLAYCVLYRGDKEGNKAKRKKVIRLVDNVVWFGLLFLIVSVIIVVRGGETIDVTLFGEGNLLVIQPINITGWFL